MEQTKLENQEQDRKFPVSHMISGYEPKNHWKSFSLMPMIKRPIA